MAALKRVIVVVFDGLRPDLVTPELMPNLLRLAARGTWFREARSVFPSLTRVAAASIGTGAAAAHHGIIGNTFLLPAYSDRATFDSRHLKDILAAEGAAGGPMVTAETFADRLAAAGRRVAIVHTGSAGATYFLNPRAARHGHWTFSIHGRDATSTPQAFDEAKAAIGPATPDRDIPRLGDARYATDLLIEHVLPRVAPDVALIWYSEPDFAFHYTELGSPAARTALQHVDAQFGRILDWVATQPDADATAIIAVSDHGHVTTTAQVPVNDLLTAAGFPAREGELGDAVLATTGGNSGEIRVRNGDRRAVARVADWLLRQDFIGMLFSPSRNEVEGEIPGTFGFDLVGLGHGRAPDLFFILRSDDGLDHHGLPGRCLFSQSVPLGGGLHGGLNRHELNSLLMIDAPGLSRAGAVTAATAGIVDVAPTVLGLFGLAPAPTMTGANLLGAESGSEQAAERHEIGVGAFRQTLTVRRRGEHLFVTHGGRSE